MPTKIIQILTLACLVLLPGCQETEKKIETVADKNTTKVHIGTDSQGSLFYTAGVSLCQTATKGKNAENIPCEALISSGSAHNLTALKEGKVELGIARADALYRAWQGQPPFKDRHSDLRVLFSLHMETMTLVARKGAGIATFRNLRGKRINVGTQGSDTEEAVSDIFKACKLPEDFEQLGYEESSQMPQKINNQSIDAFFAILDHPNDLIAKLSKENPVVIFPLMENCIEKMVDGRGYYDLAVVPGGLYQGTESDVPTFGMRVWVLAGVDVAEETVYKLTKNMFENLDEFRKLHPSFQHLSPRNMLPQWSVPYHNGAVKYFIEKGWFIKEGR